ncbi:MAG: hypothetical protein F6K62_11255 [Sphaerospermopsis sp. SIO1G2]|nr:hypothetical protein [Sphaerospermopsis sp. SIO1G2]
MGKSHRIVIEVDPALKEQIYIALRARGLTLKDWFTSQIMQDLLEDAPAHANADDNEAEGK